VPAWLPLSFRGTMKCLQGAVAQLGERQLCKLDVVGSNPISSTSFPRAKPKEAFFDKCIRRQNLRFLLSQEKFSR
jgi:hypothetical protein